MVTLLSTFVAADGPSATQMAALLSSLAETARSEPGHVAYEAFRAQEDPRLIFVKETWSSREDADAHIRRVAPAAEWSAGLLARPIETVTLDAI